MERDQLTRMSTKIHDKKFINSKILRAEIMRVVSEVFGVSEESIKGRSRIKRITNARHAYCFLSMSLDPQATLSSIGQSIGRDHSTMINSIRKCSDLREVDYEYAKVFKSCIEGLSESTEKNMVRIKFKPEHLERNYNARQRMMEQSMKAVDIVRNFMVMCDGFDFSEDQDDELTQAVQRIRFEAANQGF